ncbi:MULTISPECIES: PHP domain-containing protein [unclassified Pseudoalteromonas]|uniref:RNase RNM n=1 Tax=unclassified Pseudoalteromonas TaxID=194690 RepID=UPI0025B346AE|nr:MULTISPECIES: PHP domain-containing protein [unclassified Pseudoalteromonas]MDN3377630.1 PHP domain-containing protein [Pseudoalteromonas sp. APC 3893]MDN3385826.1 PHP domain-containing protein [Pseudoalteromonas sp. APC 4017]
MIKYDLHSHTTHSDGQLSVEQLLLRAVEKNIDVFAITDHDTVAAIEPAQAFIKSQQLPLSLIPGVEISTKWESFEIHIVALNVDVQQIELCDLLSQQQQKRAERAKEIGRRLEKNGFDGIYEQAKALAEDAQITRAHYARALVERGVAKTIPGVFKKYLGRAKTGYVPSTWCDMQTAISAIHAAGGVAVIAHPGRYQMSNKWLRKLLLQFKEAGGDAMEVAQPQQAPSERQFLGELSREYGLLCSQGSDFHFPTSWLELGKNLYLPKDCQGVWQTWEGQEGDAHE